MPWKKVNVSLEGPEDSDKNHYDTEDKVSSNDLPVEPGEQIAIFNGLEVLSGDSYKIEIKNGIKSFKVLDEPIGDKEDGDSRPEVSSNNTAKNEEGDSRPQVSSKKSKKKKKPKKSKKTQSKAESSETTVNDSAKSSDETSSLQSSWCGATGGVLLHSKICDVLLKNEFWTPTPIQAATLPAAVLGRCDIVGAAPTGSGKTLAYILPIVQHLLEANMPRPLPLQALILTPTRELALQVEKVGKAFTSIGCIVGGLAQAKQARVLDVDRPAILVGTVGRLWELMSTREHPHLNDLSQLRFLVMDEADRMIQQGTLVQLKRILDAVHRANPMNESNDEDIDEEDEEDDYDRMLGLPGIRGEAKVKMLSDDILNQLAKQRQEPADVKELEDDEYEKELKQEIESDSEEEDIELPSLPPVHRQTFIFSATLTLPNTESSKKRKRTDISSIDGAIAQLVEIAHAGGKTKIVDLSHNEKATTQSSIASEKKKQKKDHVDKFRLPPGLRLQQIKCTQLHKDSHLYAYLMTTKEGRSGPCLVFCNSIAAVKRVGTTLQTLGIQTKMLHANMQQKARIKVLESFRNATGNVVVVATDVAARGLDIPSVSTVVHYDAARKIDTFVHRSGRTARGVGQDAVGCSVSLVASDEDKMYAKIMKSLSTRFESVHMDARLLSRAQERVNLASKIVAADDMQSKTQRRNAWFREKADEAGIDLDEEEVIEEISDQRDLSRLREGKQAKSLLKKLLAEPLQTQRYGKFLSTNSAAVQNCVTR